MSTVRSRQPNEVPQRIIGAVGQAADMLVVETEDGTELLRIDKDGNITGTSASVQDAVVSGNIEVGGTVDGVDVAALASDHQAKVDQDVRTTAAPSFSAASVGGVSIADGGVVASRLEVEGLIIADGRVKLPAPAVAWDKISDTYTQEIGWVSLDLAAGAILANDGTGAVTLTKADVGLGNVTNESKEVMFTSPAFTDTPTAPTAASGTSTTQLATCAYVRGEVDPLRADYEATLALPPSTVTVHRDGTSYIAKDGLTRLSIYSGPSASSAIQAAIDLVEARGGGEVYIAAGLYELGATLTIDRCRVTLRGAGYATVLRYTGAGHALDLSGLVEEIRSGVVVRDLEIRGNGLAAGQGSGIHVNGVAYPRMHIEGVKVLGFGAGIYMKNALCSIVSNCVVHECGIGLYLETANGTVVNGCSLEYGNVGLYMADCASMFVVGGTIEGNYQHGAVLHQDVLSVTLEGVYFESNALDGPSSYYDLHLVGAAAGHVPQNISVRSCYFSGGEPTRPAIEIYVNGCKNLLLENNLHMRSDVTNVHLATGAYVAGKIILIGGKMANIANLASFSSEVVDLRGTT